MISSCPQLLFGRNRECGPGQGQIVPSCVGSVNRSLHTTAATFERCPRCLLSHQLPPPVVKQSGTTCFIPSQPRWKTLVGQPDLTRLGNIAVDFKSGFSYLKSRCCFEHLFFSHQRASSCTRCSSHRSLSAIACTQGGGPRCGQSRSNPPLFCSKTPISRENAAGQAHV